jgi:hypothetical protein
LRVCAEAMVRVRWPAEEETTAIPAPETLPVLASSGDEAQPGGTARAGRPEEGRHRDDGHSQEPRHHEVDDLQAGATKKGASKKTRVPSGRRADPGLSGRRAGHDAAALGHRLELQIDELTAAARRRSEAKEYVVDAEALDGGEAIRNDL